MASNQTPLIAMGKSINSSPHFSGLTRVSARTFSSALLILFLLLVSFPIDTTSIASVAASRLTDPNSSVSSSTLATVGTNQFDSLTRSLNLVGDRLAARLGLQTKGNLRQFRSYSSSVDLSSSTGSAGIPITGAADNSDNGGYNCNHDGCHDYDSGWFIAVMSVIGFFFWCCLIYLICYSMSSVPYYGVNAFGYDPDRPWAGPYFPSRQVVVRTEYVQNPAPALATTPPANFAPDAEESSNA